MSEKQTTPWFSNICLCKVLACAYACEMTMMSDCLYTINSYVPDFVRNGSKDI